MKPSPLPMILRRYSGLGVLLAAAVLTLLVFGRLLGAQFVRWDDFDLIVSNPLLHPPQWARLWSKPILGLYTPLSYSLQAVLAWLSWTASGTVNPLYFHAANLLLHALAAVACWRWLSWLTGDRIASALGAAFFLLHPVVVEPVGWCASLNTMLSGTLALTALALAASKRAPVQTFIAATVVFIAAMLAKPSACGLPLALLAVDRLIRRLPWRVAIGRAAIWAVIVVPFLLIGRAAQQATEIDAPPLFMRPIIALDSCGFYLLHWAIPFNFGIDYGHTPDQVGLTAGTALRVILPLAVAGIAIWQLKRRPFIAAAGLIAVAGAGPVLGLIPFDFQNYSTVADRYVYVSTAGVALGIGFALRHIATRRPIYLSAMLVAAGLAMLSYAQAGTWQDTASLLRQTTQVNPNSLAALETYGFELAQRAADPSQPPEVRDQSARQAFSLYQRILQMRPRNAWTHFNLGNLLFKTNRPAEAVAEYALAEHSLGENVRLQNNWGIACWQLHDAEAAIAHFDRGLQADPSSADTYANKAAVLMHTGHPDQAAALCRQALKLEPGQPQATRLLQQLQPSP